MSDYYHSPDNKLHTRFSELGRCTINQVRGVINERLNGSKGFQNEAMLFGETRHELWAEESKETGKIADCFPIEPYTATHIEKEFATEILPNVIVHSRPDVVSEPEATVIDYKTIQAETYTSGVLKAKKSYGSSKQLPFYTYQLGLHDIRIKKILYLVEIWNPERNTILGYTKIEKAVDLAEVATVLPWIKERVSILSSALKEAERKQRAELHQTG